MAKPSHPSIRYGHEFIRPEIEFDSVESLRLQITTDVRNARAIASRR